jgi:hypothetical protein
VRNAKKKKKKKRPEKSKRKDSGGATHSAKFVIDKNVDYFVNKKH